MQDLPLKESRTRLKLQNGRSVVDCPSILEGIKGNMIDKLNQRCQ